MRKGLGWVIATMVLASACVDLHPIRTALAWEWTRSGATAEDLAAAEYACMQDWDGKPLYELCMQADGWEKAEQ